MTIDPNKIDPQPQQQQDEVKPAVATPATPKQKAVSPELKTLQAVVDKLLSDLKEGTGDRDKRRLVEDWMRALSDKYPEFRIESGLREYYFAEAERLKQEFDQSNDLSEKLSIGRSVESFLEKAAEMDRRDS